MSKKKDSSSWQGMSEAYKNAKKEPILNEDDYISSKKKKKKKKAKRSEHKHEYIPGVYHLSYTNFNNDKKIEHITCGSHCKYCGRVKNMHFLWSHEEKRIKEFKEEYPNYIELTLPEGWDYFKNKNIPL